MKPAPRRAANYAGEPIVIARKTLLKKEGRCTIKGFRGAKGRQVSRPRKREIVFFLGGIRLFSNRLGDCILQTNQISEKTNSLVTRENCSAPEVEETCKKSENQL